MIKNSAIKFGDYILTSGKKFPYYVDLRQTISSPITMDWIANSLTRDRLDEIGKDRIDKILGVPTAGVPFCKGTSAKNWESPSLLPSRAEGTWRKKED